MTSLSLIHISCFSNTSIGKDAVPDFLSLAYYAGNYDHKAPAELPMEVQDTYVRLDNSIAELLELIDRKVGLNNTLFFITSTGSVSYTHLRLSLMGLVLS